MKTGNETLSLSDENKHYLVNLHTKKSFWNTPRLIIRI